MENHKKRYIGVDLAKKTMVVRGLSPNGKVKLSKNGKTDLSGRKRFISHLNEGDCVYMEACELAFKFAREILANTKANVYILNPRKLHIIWKSTKKTDAIDALKLARFGLRYPVEELPLVPLPTEEEEKLRAAVHELNFLKKQRTRYINRLHALFTGAGITTLTKKDLKTMKAREGSISLLTERRLAQASRICRQLKIIEEQIEEIEHEQATLLVENDTAKYIMSIPGVGPGFAATYAAFIGNGERFSNAKQVSNYSGLVPTVDQSGDKTYYGGINKASNSAIRRVAVLAAWSLIRSKHSGTLKEKYEKKARERGKLVAVVMLARKIVELCYILVKNKTYYDNGELAPENPKLKKLKRKATKKKKKVA